MNFEILTRESTKDDGHKEVTCSVTFNYSYELSEENDLVVPKDLMYKSLAENLLTYMEYEIKHADIQIKVVPNKDY